MVHSQVSMETTGASIAQYIDRERLTAPTGLGLFREVSTLPFAFTKSICVHIREPNVAGKGRVVMLMPGFGTGEWAMDPLLKVLVRHGFDAVHWGLGTNNGEVARLLEAATQQVEALAAVKDQPITLVGWSLGGYIAREVARDLPNVVDEIITFGTPAWGGPKYTFTGRYYRLQGVDVDHIENTVFERFENPITQPITAFFCDKDAVVNWECCIDHWSPNVTHREIDVPHLSMAYSSDVQREVLWLLNPTDQGSS